MKPGIHGPYGTARTSKTFGQKLMGPVLETLFKAMTGEEDNNAQVSYRQDLSFFMTRFDILGELFITDIFQALLDYFQPLIKYLEEQRAEHKYPLGWDTTDDGSDDGSDDDSGSSFAMMNIFLIFGSFYFLN